MSVPQFTYNYSSLYLMHMIIMEENIYFFVKRSFIIMNVLSKWFLSEHFLQQYSTKFASINIFKYITLNPS